MQILKAEVKEKILQVAQKTFLKVGYDKTTMREIANSCGISVGNIYRYFKNKDSLLNELIGDFGKELREFGNKVDISAFKDSSQKKTDIYINSFLELLQRNKTALTILAQNNSNKKLKEFENLIVNDITKRIALVAKEIKTIECDEVIAKAIATGSLEGIKIVILNNKKSKEETLENIKRYLTFILKDLIFRLREI